MSQFECPITKVTMTDPVICVGDGHTYERSAILAWFQNHDTSPMTNEKLGSKALVTNHAMRSELDATGYPVKSLNQRVVLDKGTSRRITLVLDVSGSMSTSVENKQTNEPSFSRLDLIKHAVSSIAGMMPENDQLSIITFNDRPRVVLNWTKMDPVGKDRALEISKNLSAGGGTDIPAGVEAGVQQGGDHTIVLTDGANMTQIPRGTLADYIISKIRDYKGVIHTVGLGMADDLDTPTLRGIASNKGGLYCFCPDASMVGTVFIHLMANICVNEPGVPFENRDKFLQTIVEAATSVSNGSKELALQLIRATKFDNDPMLNEELVSADPNKGQVEKAIINWDTWGRHYLPAFIEAHIRCMTTNFKDATLQGYASPNTRAFIDHGESVFLRITPPVPSCNNYQRTQYTAVQFATATMDSQGICFGPDTKFSVRDPEHPPILMPIKHIRKGMFLVSQDVVATVQCLVVSQPTEMVQIGGKGGFWVSKKHPLLDKQGKVPQWVHAESMLHGESIYRFQCYNLVLDTGHVVSAITDDGKEFEGVTLGHGKTGGIVEHDYLGTNRIVDDLKKCKGWESGYIQLKGLKRNNNGHICGIEEA
jgi:Mg-chelatase subunit ChlD